MSLTRQTVHRPIFTGLGKRPVFTPASQVERLTGISAGIALRGLRGAVGPASRFA